MHALLSHIPPTNLTIGHLLSLSLSLSHTCEQIKNAILPLGTPGHGFNKFEGHALNLEVSRLIQNTVGLRVLGYQHRSYRQEVKWSHICGNTSLYKNKNVDWTGFKWAN